MLLVEALLTYFAVLLVAVACDWLILTRAAADRWDSDYNYRPGRLRYSILAAAGLVFTYTYMVSEPGAAWLPGLIAFTVTLLPYVAVALRDLKRGLVPIDDE